VLVTRGFLAYNHSVLKPYLNSKSVNPLDDTQRIGMHSRVLLKLKLLVLPLNLPQGVWSEDLLTLSVLILSNGQLEDLRKQGCIVCLNYKIQHA
jgi:hypothetical protein